MNQPTVRLAAIAAIATLTTALWLPAEAATRCEHGDLVRTIEVIYDQPGQAVPCEVLYDKPDEGERETPWRAEHEAGFCEARAEDLISRLQSMGWECEAESQPDQ